MANTNARKLMNVLAWLGAGFEIYAVFAIGLIFGLE
jgi:hypothetical protein